MSFVNTKNNFEKVERNFSEQNEKMTTYSVQPNLFQINTYAGEEQKNKRQADQTLQFDINGLQDLIDILKKEYPILKKNSEYEDIKIEKVSVDLLDKKGEPQYGLNWGQREGRDLNQAYVQLKPEIYKSSFFPKKPEQFSVSTDDGETLNMVRAQKTDEGTALQTPADNALFGRYLRKRMGLEPGEQITKDDIVRYGCFALTFFKITIKDSIKYFLDFSSKNESLDEFNQSSPLNYTPFNPKDKIKSYNRIIFGAPGTGKSFRLNKEANESKFAEITRVTFHPDYSYSQFVGTYKPVMVKSGSKVTDENVSQTIEILQDKTKSAQEKYDSLYDKFKDNNLTTLPFLLGLYTDDSFTTLKKDGSATTDDNSAERNHGKAIRPYVNLKSQDDDETISYKYVSGPFLRTLVAALKSGKSGNPQNYLLIIEEINRARVAAVFGDVFQLLDRKADGESEYEIQTSEDMRNYLAEQLGGNPCEYKTLKLPNNFYIWATMNSADQGVFPMDTAFKRRWNFEYIGIDEEESGVSTYDIPINEKTKVNWNALRKSINSKLISCNVNEDKLLGPYFISKNDLKNAMQKPEDFIKLFKSKVIMYLFEDAAKMKRDFFKLTGNRKYIYSDVCKELDENGIAVFGFSDDEMKLFRHADAELDSASSKTDSETSSE